MAVLLDWDWPYRHFLGRIHITARWLGCWKCVSSAPAFQAYSHTRSHQMTACLAWCVGLEAPAPKYRFWMRPLHVVVTALVWTGEEGPILGRGGLSLRFLVKLHDSRCFGHISSVAAVTVTRLPAPLIWHKAAMVNGGLASG